MAVKESFGLIEWVDGSVHVACFCMWEEEKKKKKKKPLFGERGAMSK